MSFLLVCDVDSQLIACRQMASELATLGHNVSFALVGESGSLPPHLLKRHRDDFPQTKTFSLEDLLAGQHFLGFDAVGVYLTGSQIHGFLRKARLGASHALLPIFFCGFNGLVFEKFEEGIAWRLGYDLICLNGPRDKMLFDALVAHTQYNTQKTVIVGLNRGAAEPASQIAEPNGERRRLAVFAEQVAVPCSRQVRIHLMRQLAELARRSPGWQLLVKPRIKPQGATFHPAQLHPVDILPMLENRPENFGITYEPLDVLLREARALLTVSSTAVFEALARGCRPFTIIDLGVSNDLGTHVFVGSGLELRISSLPSLDALPDATPNDAWLSTIGCSRDFSAQSLAEAVGQLRDSQMRPRADSRQLDIEPAAQAVLSNQAFWRSSSPRGTYGHEDPVFSAYELVDQGRIAEATEILETLRQVAPRNSRCRRLLAEVYAGKGRWEQAAICLSEAYALKPHNSSLRKRLSALLASSWTRPLKLALTRRYIPQRRFSGRCSNKKDYGGPGNAKASI